VPLGYLVYQIHQFIVAYRVHSFPHPLDLAFHSMHGGSVVQDPFRVLPDVAVDIPRLSPGFQYEVGVRRDHVPPGTRYEFSHVDPGFPFPMAGDGMQV
jgi:hypothetical protein